MRSSATRSATSGGIWRFMKTKSRPVSSVRVLISCGGLLSSHASLASCGGSSFTSSGMAQIDFTGVDTASISPWRSVMRPRFALISMTRPYRDSPFARRKSLCRPCRETALRRPLRLRLARHDLDALRLRCVHVQRPGRNALHPRVHGPGARLELQLSVFDLEAARSLLLLLEFNEQLSRLVLRGHQPERTGGEQREQQQVQPHHGALTPAFPPRAA